MRKRNADDVHVGGVVDEETEEMSCNRSESASLGELIFFRVYFVYFKIAVRLTRASTVFGIILHCRSCNLHDR